MKDPKDNKLEKPRPIRKLSNKKPVKPPKFNPMWIYGVILFAMFAFVLFMQTDAGKPITFQQFEAYLKAGDVDRLVASKTGDFVQADVYIKQTSINSKPEFADIKKEQNSVTNLPTGSNPQFYFTASKDYTLVGKPTEPAPISKYEPSFKMDVTYFEKTVTFQQKIKLKTAGATVVKGSLEYMTCNDHKCLPPDDVDFTIPIGK